VPVDLAELSSISSLLAELTRRLVTIAESAADRHEDDLARELFGAERALVNAQRRLEKLLNPRR
jgi:hypothetical protein